MNSTRGPVIWRKDAILYTSEFQTFRMLIHSRSALKSIANTATSPYALRNLTCLDHTGESRQSLLKAIWCPPNSQKKSTRIPLSQEGVTYSCPVIGQSPIDKLLKSFCARVSKANTVMEIGLIDDIISACYSNTHSSKNSDKPVALY